MKDESRTKKELISELRSLRRKVSSLERKALQAERTHSEMADSHMMLDAISRLQGQAISGSDPASAMKQMLKEFLHLTGSEYGFIGEILHTPQGVPYLKSHAITNISWNRETRKFYGNHAEQGLEFTNLDTLFGEVVKTGRPVISNNPARDRRRGGLPDGHPPLKAFMGIPIKADGELLGIVGLGNKEGGYERRLITKLRPMLAICAALFRAASIDRDRIKVSFEAKAAHETLDNVLEEIAEPVVVVDADYHITFLNRAARDFYEVSDFGNGGKGMMCYRISHGASEPCGLRGDFACPKDEVFRTGQPTGLMHVHQDANGGKRHVSILATPVKDADGKVIAMVETFRDVTEYKEMEEALAESEELFRGAFEHAATGMAIVDTSGRCVESNAALQEMFGYSAGELRDLTYLDVVHPDERELDKGLFEEGLRGERSHFICEQRFVRKNGAEVWGRLSATMRYDVSGKPAFMVALIENISRRKEAEQRLAYQENFLSLIIESEPECVKLLDENCHIIRMNPSGVAMLEADSEKQLQGKDALMIVDEEFREEFQSFTKRVCQGASERLTFSITGLKGSKRWLESHAVPFEDPATGEKLLLGVTRDITDRKKMEEALCKSEERYRNISSVASDYFYSMSVSLDGEFRIDWIGGAFEQITGYRPEDMSDVNKWASVVLQEDRPVFGESTARLLENESSAVEYRIRVRGGDVRWLYDRTRPVWDGTEQRVVSVIGAVEDITERKQMEESIRQAEAAWRNTFDSISDAVSVHDRDFRIIRANKALVNLCQMPQEEIIGMRCYELLHTSGEPPKECPHMKMLREERSITEEIQDEKTGIPLLITASPMRNEEGEIIGSVHVCKDITALKMIEEDLRRSLDEREILIREVYHRVKNNLNIISSLLRLQSREVEDERTKALFMESQTRVSTMSMIHEKLYRSGNLKSLDLPEYLRELVVHVFRSMETHPGVNLVMDVEDITLGIDTIIPCALIVNELVTNALKYAFPGERHGELHISFHTDEGGGEGQYVLAVRDTGVGVPEGFDLNKSRTLGTQIVTSLAAQLDGAVELVSLNPGTEFRVTLKEKEARRGSDAST